MTRWDRAAAWPAIVVLCALALLGPPAAAVEVATGYLRQDERSLRPLSLLDAVVDDEGLAGAELGLADNATTGRFLGHTYGLDARVVAVDGDLAAAATALFAGGARFLLADLEADDLASVAAIAAEHGALVFNIRAADDRLRRQDCAAHVFHVALSRAMKADALAQYLAWKRWDRWFLLHGTTPGDLAMKAALEAAAAKFGQRIVATRDYAYEETARRVESGHTLVQRQMPAFTQEAPAHDVVVVADEADVFGEYLPYRTFAPRPVVGTQGLVPINWHRSSEQWGGTQLQNRFEDAAGRAMRERDYNAWLAMRAIGEAVTRTQSAEPAALRAYLRSDAFGVGAFKGQAVTFRPWNQQMRQPVLLAAPRMLVSVSPQEGYLHARTELDTLGVDRPQSQCRLD
jgi:ABC transporter substrate binding protein (PQQ-dependent alcohol dehydrogenase system)